MYFAATGSSSALPQILLLVLFVLVFYVLLIRPARRRQHQAAQAAEKMRQELSPGDEIVTIGGLMATVVSADDESVTLEISPGVTARYDIKAIARIVTQKDSEGPQDSDSAQDSQTDSNSVIEERD